MYVTPSEHTNPSVHNGCPVSTLDIHCVQCILYTGQETCPVPRCTQLCVHHAGPWYSCVYTLTPGVYFYSCVCT